MTVGELLARMDSQELTDWVAYDRITREDEEQDQLKRKAAEGLRTAPGLPGAMNA